MTNQSKLRINIYDNRRCHLGEGALWHPQRNQLFWFDINKKKLLTIENSKKKEWKFGEYVSSAAWVDFSTLLIASETQLFTFGLSNSEIRHVAKLEENVMQTRSNDGRSDPWGGFWISTMDKNGESSIGSIYRYYRGTVTKLFESLTIPNSICFSATDSLAYFSDTKKKIIYKQLLNHKTGWPVGNRSILADFSMSNLNPDGAVTDIEGNLWCAMWGSSEIICLSKSGEILKRLPLPVKQPSCPAFGGKNKDILYITSASMDLENESKYNGKTFSINLDVKGVLETPVKI
jgi:sugar lactone lactonase YvrE